MLNLDWPSFILGVAVTAVTLISASLWELNRMERQRK